MAFTGIMPAVPGIVLINWHIPPTKPPIKAVAGNSTW